MYRITNMETYEYTVEQRPAFLREENGQRVPCERWQAEMVDTSQWGICHMWTADGNNKYPDDRPVVVVIEDPHLLTTMMRTGDTNSTQIADQDAGIMELGDAAAVNIDAAMELGDAVADDMDALLEVGAVLAELSGRVERLEASNG